MILGNHDIFLNEIGHVVVYLHTTIQLYYGVVPLIILFAVITGSIYLRQNNLAIFTKQMLAILVFLYCSYLVSAPVWNHMKRPPLFERTGNGRNYVHTMWRSQYLTESYVVAIANVAIAVGMILVIEGEGGVRSIEQPPPQVGNKWLRSLQSCIGLILICVFFSLLLSMQKSKRRHYPYNFLFE